MMITAYRLMKMLEAVSWVCWEENGTSTIRYVLIPSINLIALYRLFVGIVSYQRCYDTIMFAHRLPPVCIPSATHLDVGIEPRVDGPGVETLLLFLIGEADGQLACMCHCVCIGIFTLRTQMLYEFR